MPGRLTQEEVKKVIEEAGCSFISCDLTKKNKYITFKCSCNYHYEDTINWEFFNKGVRCYECENIKRANNNLDKKLKTEWKAENIKNRMKDELNLEFISMERDNQNKIIIKYKCDCKNQTEDERPWLELYNKGFKCPECVKEKESERKKGKIKLTDVFLKEEVGKSGCTFIKMEKRGTQKKPYITFKCSCEGGGEHTSSWEEFRSGTRCTACAKRKMSEKVKEHYADPEKKKQTLEKMAANSLVKYGCADPTHTPEANKKREDTNIKIYGGTNCFHDPKVQEKGKETRLEKYGYEHTLSDPKKLEEMHDTQEKNSGYRHSQQNPESREKTKETHMEKLGVDHPMKSDEIKNKMKENCMKKHGVDNPAKLDAVKEKIQNNCIEKYGVNHRMQVPEIAEKQQKTAMKIKKYTAPDGTIFNCQGYEHLYLKTLIEERGYSSEEIMTGNSNIANELGAEFWYNLDGVHHRYYPDIYIKSENRLIEVKSDYTFAKDHIKNIEKLRVVKYNGYEITLVVYNKKEEIIREDTFKI